MRSSRADRRRKALGLYVQAGPSIGFGHVSRALALAETCARRGRDVRFYSEFDLRTATLFSSTGFRFTQIPRTTRLPDTLHRDRVSVLVVDVPRPDERLLGLWCDAVERLVVIDDWDVDCPVADVLVNGHVLWMDRLIRKRKQLQLRGLRYALLKPQWVWARSRYRLRRDVRRVLVTFGGSDPDDMAGRIVPSLARRFPGVHFMSVLGPGYTGSLKPNRRLPDNVQAVRNVGSLAPLALRSDVAVSAVGVTMYELASTGVPAVLVDPAPDHAIFMDAMEKQGLAIYARDEAAVLERLGELVESPSLRRKLSLTGRRRLDGRGVERVAAHLQPSNREIGHA